MIPLQDVLELGSEARMNRPGEIGGNWGWRLEPGQLEPTLGRAAPRRRPGGRPCGDVLGPGAGVQAQTGSSGSFAATTFFPLRS